MAKIKKNIRIEHPALGHRNWKWLGIAGIFIVLGYLALIQGPADNPLSVTVAPLLLALGYIVFVPIGLSIKPEPEKAPNQDK